MLLRRWAWLILSDPVTSSRIRPMCHDVLHCCHTIATPYPHYCPVLTRLTSGTGKFSYVVLCCVLLLPRCSLAAATLSYAVPRWSSLLPCNSLLSVFGYINLVTCDTRLILAHNRTRFLHDSATPQPRCTMSCHAIVTLAKRCCYVIVLCGKSTWILKMFKIQVC